VGDVSETDQDKPGGTDSTPEGISRLKIRKKDLAISHGFFFFRPTAKIASEDPILIEEKPAWDQPRCL